MSPLEQEVLEKFQQLDESARQRVLASLKEAAPAFDEAAWWATVEALQAEMRARLGPTGTVGALSLLAELREEAS